MKNCPNCGSERLYRKNPTSLIIHCQDCKKTAKAKQSLKPVKCRDILIDKIKYHIFIWYCPIDPDCYSFAVSAGGSLPYQIRDFEEDPLLGGRYGSIDGAVEGAINWLKDW